VVLLNPWLRADSDPAADVRRLTGAAQRVLLVDGPADLSMVAATLAAGAHGYLTRDHDAAALARTVRGIAAGETPWSLGPTQAPGARGPGRPPLSERGHGILMACASRLTLDSAARRCPRRDGRPARLTFPMSECKSTTAAAALVGSGSAPVSTVCRGRTGSAPRISRQAAATSLVFPMTAGP
jgi:hypothetical protein